MIIPVQHEEMRTRRWPIITLGVIVVNLAVFLGTHWTMEKQDAEMWQVKARCLILAARHPQLTLAPEAREFVDDFRSRYPDDSAEIQNPNSEPVDDWDSRTRLASS